MWATVLVLALMTAIEPVRLAVAIFLISGPRPLINLLAFWLGGMATGIGAVLGVLVLLRDFASAVVHDLESTATGIVASSTVQHIQICIGVLALLIAAVFARGFSVRQRARAPITCGEPSPLLPSTPTASSRLFARAHDTLEAGVPWVAFGVGLSSAGPSPVEFLLAVTAILASGTAIGTQLGAAVAYVVVMLAIVEIPLVSYVAKPAKTQAVMLQMSDWLRTRRREILALIVAVMGVVLVATGMGNA
jgi:Sap-like sulfolipid-1-addressing protein